MNEQDLQAFCQEIRKEIPKFEVAFKTESLQMKVLGLLLTPFNPGFMTKFTTTWGSKVYFPTREKVTADPLWAFSILAHEFVHLMDDKEHGFFGFKSTYALPQILAILPLAAFGVLGGWPVLLSLFMGYLFAAITYKLLPKPIPLAFWVAFVPSAIVSLVWGWFLVEWWILLIVISLGMLVLPSPWRTKWELRGYTMTIAVLWWLYRRGPSDDRYASLLKNFVGGDYLFMSWSIEKTKRDLLLATERVKSGAVLSEKPYHIVYDFLKERGLLV